MKETILKATDYVPDKTDDSIKKQYNLEKLVHMYYNENPYGPSKKVKEAIKKWDFSFGSYYPDGYERNLRKSISAKYHLNPNNLVFGAGLDEILQLISMVLLEEDDQIIVPDPTYPEYEIRAKFQGASAVRIPVDKVTGHVNFSEMLNAINDKTKIIWLCNPNNPTGVLENISDIENFIREVPENIYVIIDEAYIDFVSDIEPDEATCFNLINRYSNVAVLRTFSKIYGLANYRVGYIAASKSLADAIQKVRMPFNMSDLSQLAAEVAFEDQEYIHKIAKKNAKQRKKWEKFLRDNDLTYYHSQSNFVLFECPGFSDTLSEYLLTKGYKVQPNLAPDTIRVSIGKKKDNKAVQKLVKHFLEKNS